ncbi:hypothetical protein LHP98_18185 [Rhodobacter sp. Har01]|uniref:alpha-L-rhamnosidase-related protein n=1 Tax=Rhodobacter sp. Har01 TaxID=2883999 RepID=UPI001D0929E3|nr:hypothetical protein [Rhodobacter sp. Har01]MCB6180052.1 hypothetical protein [Rhodobacter sp. Har01]
MKAPEGTFWIGPEHPFDLSETYLNIRADVTIDRPGRAYLNLSADSRYRLWVNGAFCGRGPERSWPTSMAVDRIDVARHLTPGLNRIAVQVYSPGYSHFAYVHRAACGLIAWLSIDDAPVLRTDTTWRVRRDPSWSPLVPRVSIYGTGVEQRDMARAEDWQQADASDWPAARIEQPPEGPIWAALRPRAMPRLVEETRALTTPWQTRLGPTPPATDDPHADLIAAFAACPPGGIPKALTPGQTAIWVFDLGETRAVLAGAQVTGAGGEVLTVSYAERLCDGQPLLPDPQTYCRMRPSDRTTLRPGRQTVEGFTPRGGRYLIFRLDAVATVTPAPAFHAILPHYPLTERPLPKLPAPLAAAAKMCRRTTRNCLQDGFVDSLWRESSQWLGDALPQAFALQALSDDPRPLRFTIDMAAEGAAPDGVLPSILPGEVPAYVVTDYNFAWVQLLAAYADHPGATDAPEVIARHWPTLTRLLDRFLQDRAEDGLIRSQPGRRLFLDWSPMARDEPNLTYNLSFLHALHSAARLAARFGRPDAWSASALALANTLRQTHRAEDGWRESPGGAPACQLALALLVLTGTAADEAPALADRIAARSLDLDDGASPGTLVLASPFMHHTVFQALWSQGRAQDIRAIIAARWGRWAAAGQPTTWENWSIDFPDGSACHGFSAHPLGWLARCPA